MKLIVLLFLTLVIISCGQSKEKKAVCEAFEAFNVCAQKASIEEVATCSVSVAQEVSNKMGGNRLELSDSKLQEMESAAAEYGKCILDASIEASAVQTAGGSTTGLSTTTTDLEAKKKAATEKFKSAFKGCLSAYISKGKEIIECN